MIYIGAGTSGTVGGAGCVRVPATFSTPIRHWWSAGWLGAHAALTHASERLEDDAQAGANAVAELGIGPLDSVVGLTASGRTPYVLGAIEAAQCAGCFTIGVACNATVAAGRNEWR